MPITQNMLVEDATLPPVLPYMTPYAVPGSSAGFSPSPVFAPPDIPGNTLWLRSDMGITIATGVSVWADQSGLGHNVAQATGANQPTFNASGGPNGLPYVSANGTTQYLHATWTQAQPTERFVVAVWPPTYVTTQYLTDGGNLNGLTIFRSSLILLDLYCGATIGATMTNPTTWQMYDAQSNGTTSSISQSGVIIAAGNAGSNAAGGCALFANANGSGNFVAAGIAEVIDYNFILTPDQRSQVRYYLQNRYLIP